MIKSKLLKDRKIALLIDQLNAQVGVCGALTVENYHKVKKQDFLNRYADYIELPEEEEEEDEPVNDKKEEPSEKSLPARIVGDHKSLVDILTQIQFDLFDIKLLFTDKKFTLADSRINDKSHQWLEKMIESLAKAASAVEGPILPIGNMMATNFFVAHNFSEQLSTRISDSLDDADPITMYLSLLSQLLLRSGLWSNLIHREHVFSWKPKAEMKQMSQKDRAKESE